MGGHSGMKRNLAKADAECETTFDTACSVLGAIGGFALGAVASTPIAAAAPHAAMGLAGSGAGAGALAGAKAGKALRRAMGG